MVIPVPRRSADGGGFDEGVFAGDFVVAGDFAVIWLIQEDPTPEEDGVSVFRGALPPPVFFCTTC